VSRSPLSTILNAGIAAIFCALIAGCVGAGQPVKYYRLEVPLPPSAAAETPFAVTLQVGNLDSPPVMRDGRILYQVGSHEVGAYEYHRWVENPDRMVQDSLVRMLRATGKYQSVDTPRSGGRADYFLQGRIYEFSEVDKPEVYSRVSMEIELHDGKTFRTVWSHLYNKELRVDGRQIPDVVESLDQNLQRGLTEIVAGLNQYFAGRATATPQSKPVP
jgi:ABC-type uncharacterized transport system auxiliary subunit